MIFNWWPQLRPDSTTAALHRAAGAIAADYMNSPEAREVIAKAVRETVNRKIEQSLQSYSEFGKQVEEAVQKALCLHGNIDLPSYNDTILKIVAAQVQHATTESIQAQVAARMKDLLTPAPKTIFLSQLVREYVDALREKEESGCVCYGERKEITFDVSDRDISGFLDITLSPERNTKRQDCEIRFGVHLKANLGPKTGTIYHLVFKNQDLERRMFVGPFYGFERSLFQMKAAGTAIVLDHEEVDIETDYTPAGHHD